MQRTGGKVEVRNYSNSRDQFDSFKFTGLNNFDFLRYDYINEQTEAAEEVAAGRAD